MKKVIAAALVASMAISMTACGSSSQDSSAAAETTEETVEETEEAAEEAEAEEAEAEETEETEETTEVTTVLVSINNAQPPASWVEDDGSIAGQNYEVMMLVDELLPQYEFEWEAVDQDAMIMGLDSGKYAAAVGNFWWNEKRAEAYLFPEIPIGGGIEGIAVNKKYEEDVQSLEDFATLGLKLTPNEASGAMYDVFTQFNEENPDIALTLETGDVIAAGEQLKWVKEGRYDGAAMFGSEFDELKDEIDPEDELYFVPFYAVKTWVLYGKDQAELAAAIDGVMEQLLEDGTLADISEKWFGYNVYDYFD